MIPAPGTVHASPPPRKAPRLMPHQRQAVTAAAKALAGGGRATVVAACGTGKTYISAAVADRLAPRGRTLILLPTLDLLAQTASAWRTWGRGGRVIAVCGDEEALRHDRQHDLDGEVTTSPGVVAALARAEEPATVFATYASLPKLTAAHQHHGMPPFDLVIADEAHRTAGRLGRRWTAIHDNTAIPAHRRLYLTATPKVFGDDASGTPAASMHDTALFGPIVYRLTFGQAIKNGLLADYRVIVPVITEADLHELVVSRQDASHELALQIAVLRAAAKYGLRRVLSYHSRVHTARGFAHRLPDAYHLLPDGQRPSGLWANWISGNHRLTERQDLLDTLRDNDRAFALLANARVLNEGVDVPAVDAVVIADHKHSMIDTVQAVGRALRTGGRADKVATIIVPAFIRNDDNPENVLEGPGYATVWRVLRALRAHDERLDERLADLRTGLAQDSPAEFLSWLSIEDAPRAADLALAVTLRLVDAKSAEWRRGFAAARRFHATHGHVNAPQGYQDDKGVHLGGWLNWQRWCRRQGVLPAHRVTALEELGILWDPRKDQWQRGLAAASAYRETHGHLAAPTDAVEAGVKLGVWLRNLRVRCDELPADRIQALDALDPWWNPPWRLTWQRNYHAARAYREAHGHLDIPRTHIADNGLHVGEWLFKQRCSQDALDPRQRDLLNALGMNWGAVSPHEQKWRRGLLAAIRYFDDHHDLDVPQKYIDPDGFRLGAWINNLRRRRDTLPRERVKVLDAMHMRWK